MKKSSKFKSKIAAFFCVMFGHSKIVETCFGYVHCARCGDLIGDAFAGVFDGSKCVIVGHNCKTCQENYKKLKFKDRFLCPYPFKKEDV